MQREETPVMTTELERIAAKARCEPEFGSLDQVWLARSVEHRVGDPSLIKAKWPLQRPRLTLPYWQFQAFVVL